MAKGNATSHTGNVKLLQYNKTRRTEGQTHPSSPYLYTYIQPDIHGLSGDILSELIIGFTFADKKRNQYKWNKKD
jgi:hypothetical protein